MTKSLSIRLPDELAARIEGDAKETGDSINTRVIKMLEAARTVVPNPITLSVRIARNVAERSVTYHAEENMGLNPVINSHQDLEHWVKFVLLDVSGSSEGETEIGVVADDVSVVITGNIEAIKIYIL